MILLLSLPVEGSRVLVSGTRESIAKIDSARVAIGELSTQRDSLEALRLDRARGQAYYNLGLNDRALKAYLDAVGLSRALGIDTLTADIYNNIFGIYYYEHRPIPGLDLLDDALEIYRREGLKREEVKVLNNLALGYGMTGDYAIAEEHIRAALDAVGDDTVTCAGLHINLADLYVAKGVLEEAGEELGKAVEMVDGHPDGQQVLIQGMLNLASVSVATGDAISARRLARKVEKLLGGRTPSRMPDSYAHLADIYFNLGDSMAALPHVLAFVSLSDSLKNELNGSQMQELLVAYDTERLRRHNERLNETVKERTRGVVFGIFAALLLTAVIIYVVWRMRFDRRRNAVINAQREKILDYERKEHERQSREMGYAIDRKNRELTSLAIDIAAVNEFHSQLGEELKQVRKLMTDGDDEAARSVLMHSIGTLANFGDNAMSMDFKIYFEQVHPEFLTRVKEAHPVLTQTDLRLCAFLSLGMPTKEIAALIHREVRSVESSRLRLRRKLELPGDMSLFDYLQGFMRT